MTGSATIEAVDHAVRTSMEAHGVPGVAVGVRMPDARSFACRGVTNIEHPLPVTTTTRFQVGSVTKTVTAAAIARLADEGRLDLDVPVGRLLPSLRLQDPSHLGALTTRRILCHRSGIFGDWILHAAADFGAGDDALARMVDHLHGVPLLVGPGLAFSYSNTAYCLAGHLLASITGRSYEDAVTELALAPARLDDSSFSAEDAITHRVAAGHHRRPDGTVVVARGSATWSPRWALQRAANPAGGLISTPEDLLAWAEQFLDRPSSGIAPAVRASMLTVHSESGGQGTHAGLGWHLRHVDGTDVWSHNGVTDGYVAHALVVPALDVAATILTNCSMGHLVIDGARTALLQACGLDTRLPRPIAVSPKIIAGLGGTYEDPLRRLTILPSAPGVDIELRIRDRVDRPLGDVQHMAAVPIADGRLRITEPSHRAGQGLEYPHAELTAGGPAPWIRFRGRLHPRA